MSGKWGEYVSASEISAACMHLMHHICTETGREKGERDRHAYT